MQCETAGPYRDVPAAGLSKAALEYQLHGVEDQRDEDSSREKGPRFKQFNQPCCKTIAKYPFVGTERTVMRVNTAGAGGFND